MKRLFVPLVAALACASLVIVGCTQAAPVPTATKAPAAAPAAAPTKAPGAAPTTALAAAPTKAPAAAATAAPAAKASYPEKGKAITVIVTTAAGGSIDAHARALAAVMEKDLGVPIQVVNKAGAGHQIGLTEIANAKPDGYTIGWTSLPSSITNYMDTSRKATFNRKSFDLISNIVTDYNAFFVKSDSKYKTLKDMIDDAKAHPGEVKVATMGILTSDEIVANLLEGMAGVKFKIVRFASGGTDAATSLLGGHVDVHSSSMGTNAAQVKGGQMRALFVASEKRSELAEIKDVPTLKEAGYNLTFCSERGLMGPAGLPKEVITVLNNSVKKCVEDPEFKNRLSSLNLGINYMGPDGFASLWDDFEKKLKPLVEQALEEQKKK